MTASVTFILQHMTQEVHKIQQDPSRPTITDQEFEDKLLVWTESTTTSPSSGIHLGHFKALSIAQHSYASNLSGDDKSTLEFQQQRDKLNCKEEWFHFP